MDRGTDSINNLLNYILFSILPTIIDIIVAVLFFVSAFNKWFGLIVFTTMLLYIGKYNNNNNNRKFLQSVMHFCARDFPPSLMHTKRPFYSISLNDSRSYHCATFLPYI